MMSMSVLDDARWMAANAPHDLCEHCWHCNGAEGGGPTLPGCPWLALPRIVAALEAAEKVVEMLPGFLLEHHECDGSEWCVMVRGQHHVWYCDSCDERVSCDCDTHEEGLRGAHLRAWARLVHDDGCPLGVLETALRGDPIAKTASHLTI